MDDVIARIAESLAARVSGPMKFRMVMQPLMSTIFAVLAGLKDAKAGKPPYLWGLISHPERRKEMLMDGWKGIGKVFVLALALDIVYQFVVEHSVQFVDSVLVAFLLAIVPYLVLRGLVTRIARKGKA